MKLFLLFIVAFLLLRSDSFKSDNSILIRTNIASVCIWVGTCRILNLDQEYTRVSDLFAKIWIYQTIVLSDSEKEPWSIFHDYHIQPDKESFQDNLNIQE